MAPAMACCAPSTATRPVPAPAVELWGFIAPEHWSALDRVRTNSPLIAYPSTPSFTPAPQPKSYFFDGSIGGYQERTATSVNKLWIYPTMRRGGRSVYAFDVTNRPGAIVAADADVALQR